MPNCGRPMVYGKTGWQSAANRGPMGWAPDSKDMPYPSLILVNRQRNHFPHDVNDKG